MGVPIPSSDEFADDPTLLNAGEPLVEALVAVSKPAMVAAQEL